MMKYVWISETLPDQMGHLENKMVDIMTLDRRWLCEVYEMGITVAKPGHVFMRDRK